MQQVVSNAPIRVRAVKGFYATVDGKFGVVNPDDIVDLERNVVLALGQKVAPVLPSEQCRRNPSWLPERKKNPKPDQATETASLRAAVEALTQTVAALVAGNSNKAKGKEAA